MLLNKPSKSFEVSSAKRATSAMPPALKAGAAAATPAMPQTANAGPTGIFLRQSPLTQAFLKCGAVFCFCSSLKDGTPSQQLLLATQHTDVTGCAVLPCPSWVGIGTFLPLCLCSSPSLGCALREAAATVGDQSTATASQQKWLQGQNKDFGAPPVEPKGRTTG